MAPGKSEMNKEGMKDRAEQKLREGIQLLGGGVILTFPSIDLERRQRPSWS